MSSAASSVSLDLTPEGLFPEKETAATDPKCVVISEIMRQMTEKVDMSNVPQSTLRVRAAIRYKYLSQEDRLSLPEADHGASLLYRSGVASATAQKYYSFRLSEADVKRWSIVIV